MAHNILNLRAFKDKVLILVILTLLPPFQSMQAFETTPVPDLPPDLLLELQSMDLSKISVEDYEKIAKRVEKKRQIERNRKIRDHVKSMLKNPEDMKYLKDDIPFEFVEDDDANVEPKPVSHWLKQGAVIAGLALAIGGSFYLAGGLNRRINSAQKEVHDYLEKHKEDIDLKLPENADDFLNRGFYDLKAGDYDVDRMDAYARIKMGELKQSETHRDEIKRIFEKHRLSETNSEIAFKMGLFPQQDQYKEINTALNNNHKRYKGRAAAAKSTGFWSKIKGVFTNMFSIFTVT